MLQKITVVLLCLVAVNGINNNNNNCSTEAHDDLIRTLTKLFTQKHVQTVSVSTCWRSDKKSRLLFELSSVDISVNFYQTAIPVYHHTWYRYGILVDVSCTQIATVLFQQASKDRLFDMRNNWILINSRADCVSSNDGQQVVLETFETYLSEAYVLPESNVFLLVQTNDRDSSWDIWEGFKVSKTERIRVYRHGSASVNRLEVLDNNSVSLRSDLRGITLKATTVISEPKMFKGFYPFAETDLDIFAHMHNDMNIVLQDQLNFRMNLMIVDSFGWDLGNGSFSGLTGQLQRDECDFGGIGSFIRADRMTVIDYTVGTFYREGRNTFAHTANIEHIILIECIIVVFVCHAIFKPSALFKQPPLSSVRNICVLPFKFEVWMAMLITLVGFTVLIIFLAWMTQRFEKNGDEALTILDSVIIVHGAICQQGYTMNLNTISIRVAIFVLFLTAVFLFTSYSASIVALLQSPSDSIKTVRDLVESSMTFTAQISPYGQVYFDETDDPYLRKLYNKKMKHQGTQKFTLASEGIAKIRTEFHGFMVEVVSAYKLISRLWREEEKCGFSEIQLFKLPILALAVIKKSGYKDIFKQKLMHQEEVGIKNRIIRRWIPPKPMCDSSNRANQFVSVSIKEIYPMLQIYGFGLCVSIVVLFLEIGYETYTRYRAKHDDDLFYKIFGFTYNKR